MPSLSQLPFLQALGYAIANSLWQMALVWIVFVLLNSVFKFRSEIKYKTAVAAQLIGFSWFVITLQFYYKQCSEALQLAKAMSLHNGGESVLLSPATETFSGYMLNFVVKTEQVLPYLSIAYIVLLVFLTLRWFRAYRYTQIVRLNGLHKIDVDWKLFVNRIASQLGIKQTVRIYLSELVKSPVTIGFIKPVILVPIASINHLTVQQLEAVILHELAHIKRHDYLLNILLSIIELALFFNPFTRLINKSISKERENSCDDWVLQYQYNPSMYAEALLRIAVLQKTPVMAMHAVKSKGELVARVQRMIHQKDSRFSYRHQLLALLLMTGILTSLAWFDPNQLKTQETASAIKPTELPYVVEPLAAKVDNPFFNPISFFNEPLKEEVQKTIKLSRKELARVKRDLETAAREIELPKISPVTVENLELIEKSLSHVEKNMKKGLFSTTKMRTQLDQLHSNYFTVDSLVKHRNNFTFAFAPFGMQWQSQSIEELKKAEVSIAKALKTKQISAIDAKKFQEDIHKAMEDLKHFVMPTTDFGFADKAGAGVYYFDGSEEEAKLRSLDKFRTYYQTAPTAAFRQRNEKEELKEIEEHNRNSRIASGQRKVKMKIDSLELVASKKRHELMDNKAVVRYQDMVNLHKAPIVVTEGEYTLTVPQGKRVVTSPGATAYTYVYGNTTKKKETTCIDCKEKETVKSECEPSKTNTRTPLKPVTVNGKIYHVPSQRKAGEPVITIEIH